MDVKFVVFVNNPPTSNHAKLLNTFNDLGYATFCDGVHGKDYDWLMKNIVQARLFIYDDDKIYMFGKEKLTAAMTFLPDFAIIFNENANIGEEHWNIILTYLEQHLTDAMIDMTNTMKAHELLGKPTFEVAKLEDVPMEKSQDFYSLTRRLLEDKDIMLYEVRKPFTDLPYTSVTRNYSKKGHIPFFTDLFICQSWGVARSDISFLKHMWDELQMDGDFDLDQLMKAATEKCYPADDNIPEPEPEVYRRSLEDVIVILKEKESRQIRVIPEFIKN
jgi:hypothetical protein